MTTQYLKVPTTEGLLELNCNFTVHQIVEIIKSIAMVKTQFMWSYFKCEEIENLLKMRICLVGLVLPAL